MVLTVEDVTANGDVPVASDDVICPEFPTVTLATPPNAKVARDALPPN